MLLEFSCSNHKSIREKVLFSVVAGKDKTFDEEVAVFNGIKVLKSAVIYGANGAGKSNLIHALSFVRRLVIHSVNNQPGDGILQIPHRLDGYEKESSYQIQFVTNEIHFVFGFSLEQMLVTDEYLYYYSGNRRIKIFERDKDGFQTGSRFRNKFTACKDVLKPNRLLLSCAANFTSVPEVIAAYRFFLDEMVIYYAHNQSKWMNYSLYQMNRNPEMKQSVLTFLDELGTGIKDIQVEIDQTKLTSAQLPPFISDEYKAILLQKDVDAITAKVVYDNFEIDLMQEESAGVRKLFGILCPILDIMSSGKIFICDELESGLHEFLVYGLVKLFVRTKTKRFAQMIFTTHETGLLNPKLFRRDQIWFAEMRPNDRSTDLYSLAEFKNVEAGENFGGGYIAGRYGAIPMLNLDFARIISRANGGAVE